MCAYTRNNTHVCVIVNAVADFVAKEQFPTVHFLMIQKSQTFLGVPQKTHYVYFIDAMRTVF